MVKSYLRFSPNQTLGVISSSNSPTIFDITGRLVVAPSLDNVAFWNAQTSTLVHELKLPPPSLSTSSNLSPELVTFLARSPNAKHICVGYNDGCIRIWDYQAQECLITLNGHRSAITSLTYNKDGSMLASGSKDSTIVVWDTLNECGLYRLYGHKGEMTDLKFLEKNNYLISSSKDTFVKFWDLDTQHCFQTLVDHHSEVWSFDVNADETRLVTGCHDQEIRIFKLKEATPTQTHSQSSGDAMDLTTEDNDKKNGIASALQFATYVGSVIRESKQRTVQLKLNPRGDLLFCLGAAKLIEIFKVRTAKEIKKKLKRKMKRRREKARADGTSTTEGADPQTETVTGEDMYERYLPLRAKVKIRSFSFDPKSSSSSSTTERILISLHNNSIAVYEMNRSDKKNPYSQTQCVDRLGHRQGVRFVCFNKDSSKIMSTSNDQIKIWNPDTRSCIRTQSSGFGLCGVLFGPRHAIIGTKDGDIEIYDIGAATLVRQIKAHEGSVWCLEVFPDNKGLATGGVDNCVKFWDFDLITDENGSKRLSLEHTRTLKLTDDVLCLKFSPNGRYIAVGLLDTTIKVFHADTLKFFLSLYGHKLPVLSIDISSDNTLLVSGAVDKDVKIWGMDFGDCHKSMFAHDKEVTQVKFVPDTHYFFSAGKDKLIKYWDADKFEHIMTLEGHFSEIWGLDISSNGLKLVSGSSDKSIRIWEQTEEQLFLEEEREMELDRMFEKEDNRTDRPQPGAIVGSGLNPLPESGNVSKSNTETLKLGERLMESLDLAKEEESRWEAYREAKEKPRTTQPAWLSEVQGPSDEAPKEPAPNMLLQGQKPDQYILKQLLRIKPAQIEEVLLVLPFEHARILLSYLSTFVNEGEHIELVMRCILFLFKIHQSQIVSSSSPSMLNLLRHISETSRKTLQHYKDMIGFNAAAMKVVVKHMERSNKTYVFGEREHVVDVLEEREKKRKRLMLEKNKLS